MRPSIAGAGERVESRGAQLSIAAVVIATIVALLIPSGAQGASTESRYSIVNGCFALQSTSAGGFVTRAGGGFDASASGAGAAEPFFMRATDLGRFLLYGSDESFLALGGGGNVSAAAEPGDDVDFTVTKQGGAFQFVNEFTGQSLAVSGGELTGGGSPENFKLVEVGGCADYPEIPHGTKGKPSKGMPRYGEVNGAADAHMHLMAYEFLGGEAHCGEPWHRFGPAFALVDCIDHVATDGCGAILETAVGGDPCHATDGWPTFNGWPKPHSLTHEGTYWRWFERAWRGGLRLYTNLLVENRALCEIYPLKKNSCNEFESVKLQAQRMHEFEDYIDAQYGGPGEGWFRIVKNPFKAREVINSGKLAVVMGMEVSEPFNCRLFMGESTCSVEDALAGLEEIHKMGVRQMEFVNKFDNAFTGVAGDGGSTGAITNGGNFYATGRFWDMESCKEEHNHDRDPAAADYPHNDDEVISNGIAALLPVGAAPVYPEGPICNTRGLTALGEVLLEEVMRKKMIFDPDHMSVAGRDEALAIVGDARYPGILSSHSWSTPVAQKRIVGLDGFIAPYAGGSEGFVGKWQSVKDDHAEVGGRQYFGLGYGADMNGLGGQGDPRGEDAPNKVTYPFKSPIDPKVTIKKQKSGEKVWDVNVDGVAHYGMYADWFQDVGNLGGRGIIRDLRRGAESYLQMWERTYGVGRVRCPAWAEDYSRKGLGRSIPLGAKPKKVLFRAGQPVSRERSWSWCARSNRKLGSRKRTVVAVFRGRDSDARSGLVLSSLSRHSAGGIDKGARHSALVKRADRVTDTIYTRDAGKGARYVYLTDGKRVKALGVGDRFVTKGKDLLERYVKRADITVR